MIFLEDSVIYFHRKSLQRVNQDIIWMLEQAAIKAATTNSMGKNL
jgi:hypothetical protein